MKSVCGFFKMSFSCWTSFQNRNSQQARKSCPAQNWNILSPCAHTYEMSERLHFSVYTTFLCLPPAPGLSPTFVRGSVTSLVWRLGPSLKEVVPCPVILAMAYRACPFSWSVPQPLPKSLPGGPAQMTGAWEFPGEVAGNLVEMQVSVWWFWDGLEILHF